MKTKYLSKLTKKVAVITSIIGLSALVGTPVIAQINQTPDSTTESPAEPTTPGTIQSPTPDPNIPTPEATPAPTAAPDAATTGNLIAVAQSSGSFNTLAQAVQAAGLAEKLSSGEYTIFAPTDQAFSTSLPPGAVDFLLLPENRELLRKVLTYHVVSREVTASQLKTGKVETLGGGVAVRVTPQRVILNNASVVQPNIQASNGVIHAVNRVLLPRQLRQTIASKLEQQPTQAAPTQTTPAVPIQPTPVVPDQTSPTIEPNQTTPDQTSPTIAPTQTTPDQTSPTITPNQMP